MERLTGAQRDRLCLILCALLLIGGVAGPSLPGIAEGFWGYETVDHYGTQWFYWFAGYHLEEGLSPLHTDLFFYPWGKDIFGHTGANLLDAYLAVPLLRLLGPVAGYNVFLMLGIAASAWAFHRLCRLFSDDSLAVGVATLGFAVNPYCLFELADGRPTQAILLFPVLFLHDLWLSREPGWRAPIRAGLWLAITGYQYWYYALFGGLAALGHGLWLAAAPGAAAMPDRLRLLARHAGIAAVSLLLCAPVALPMVAATMRGGEVPGLLDVSGWSLTDAPPVTVEGISIAISVFQPLTGSIGYFMRDPGSTVERFVSYLPPLSPALLLVMILWLRRPPPPPEGSGLRRLDRGSWLAMALALTVVAAGPVWIVGKGVLPNALYMLLAGALSFVRRLWWSSRAVGLLSILWYLPIAVVLPALPRRRLIAAGLSLALLTQLAWFGLAPMPVWDATIPAGYRCLASGPPGAVIELPWSWTQAHLYYQTAHHRPIFGGMIEDNTTFTDPEFTAFREDNTFIDYVTHQILADNERDQNAESTDSLNAITEADRKAVYDLGYRYILLQKDALATQPRASAAEKAVNRTRIRRVLRAMERVLGRPVYDDARVVLYAPWGDPSPCPIDPDLLDREPHPLLSTSAVKSFDAYRRFNEFLIAVGLGTPGEAADNSANIVTWFYGGPEADPADTAAPEADPAPADPSAPADPAPADPAAPAAPSP